MSDTYRLVLTGAEREQVIIALELALALSRGDGDGLRLVLDVERGRMDRLADRLFCATPSTA